MVLHGARQLLARWPQNWFGPNGLQTLYMAWSCSACMSCEPCMHVQFCMHEPHTKKRLYVSEVKMNMCLACWYHMWQSAHIASHARKGRVGEHCHASTMLLSRQNFHIEAITDVYIHKAWNKKRKSKVHLCLQGDRMNWPVGRSRNWTETELQACTFFWHSAKCGLCSKTVAHEKLCIKPCLSRPPVRSVTCSKNRTASLRDSLGQLNPFCALGLVSQVVAAKAKEWLDSAPAFTALGYIGRESWDSS